MRSSTVVSALGRCGCFGNMWFKGSKVTFGTEAEEISGEDLPVSLMMKRSFNQIRIVRGSLFLLLRRLKQFLHQ